MYNVEVSAPVSVKKLARRKVAVKPKKAPTVDTSTSRDRQMFTLLRIIRDKKATEIARKAKVSPSTVYKWRKDPANGGTMYPKANTMIRVLMSYGYGLEIVERKTGKIVK